MTEGPVLICLRTPKHPADICHFKPFVSALLVKQRPWCSTEVGGPQSIFTNIMRMESAPELFKLSSGGFSEYYYRGRAYFTHVHASLLSSLHVPALDPPHLTVTSIAFLVLECTAVSRLTENAFCLSFARWFCEI